MGHVLLQFGSEPNLIRFAANVNTIERIIETQGPDIFSKNRPLNPIWHNRFPGGSVRLTAQREANLSSELVKNAGGRVHFQSPSGNASTEFIIGLPRSRSSLGEEGSKDYK